MPIGSITAIKRYFELDGGKKVELAELRALSKSDREELGFLSAQQLGETLDH